jgi:hypothetical protein
MRARGFVTFRLSHPVESSGPWADGFPIEAGTVLAVHRPHGLLRYRTSYPYAIASGHSAVEVEVQALEHGVQGNLPAMNTMLVVENDRLRSLNQAGALDVHNAQEFFVGTDDDVETVRPVPDTPVLVGDRVPAWNDAMLRITRQEQARARQRAEPRHQMDVNGNTFYIDAQANDEVAGTTTLTLTSTDGSVSLDSGANYVWSRPQDTSAHYDRGDWTEWYWGRGEDHEGERWVWRIRSRGEGTRPCPDCEQHARHAAERGIMVTRCSTICRRQIMVVPARAVEAEPVVGWTREPTLMECWGRV